MKFILSKEKEYDNIMFQFAKRSNGQNGKKHTKTVITLYSIIELKELNNHKHFF